MPDNFKFDFVNGRTPGKPSQEDLDAHLAAVDHLKTEAQDAGNQNGANAEEIVAAAGDLSFFDGHPGTDPSEVVPVGVANAPFDIF